MSKKIKEIKELELNDLRSRFKGVKDYVILEPIKVDAGYLILKVEEHQKAGLATMEEVENEVQEKLFTPLPLLGIPGWCAGNADVCFYDDAQVFRPRRAPERKTTPPLQPRAHP